MDLYNSPNKAYSKPSNKHTITMMVIAIAVVLVGGWLFYLSYTYNKLENKNIDIDDINSDSSYLKNIKDKYEVTVYGDLNLDSRVNDNDYTYLEKYLSGEITLKKQALVNADVNNDNKVDEADLLIIKKHINNTPGYEVLPVE